MLIGSLGHLRRLMFGIFDFEQNPMEINTSRLEDLRVYFVSTG